MPLVHDCAYGTAPVEIVRGCGRGDERRAGGDAATSDAAVAESADRCARTRPRRRAVRSGEAALRADGCGGGVPGGCARPVAAVGRGGTHGAADTAGSAGDAAAAVRPVGDLRGAAADTGCLPGGVPRCGARSGDADDAAPDGGAAGWADRRGTASSE